MIISQKMVMLLSEGIKRIANSPVETLEEETDRYACEVIPQPVEFEGSIIK